MKNVIKLNENTYLIKDVCFCYLLIGKKKALLIDTGIGLKNISKIVKKITDKEIIVVNTHGHIDHIGSNSYFKEVHIHEKDVDVYNFQNSSIFRKYFISKIKFPLSLFAKKLKKPIESNLITIDDTKVFELGDRSIKVIHTPGHTPGSICLLDEGSKTIYGGDTLVPILVLLNLDYSLTPEIFLSSMEKLDNYRDKFEYIYPGHHSTDTKKDIIDNYINAAKDAILKKGELYLDEIGISRVSNYKNVKIFAKVDYSKLKLEDSINLAINDKTQKIVKNIKNTANKTFNSIKEAIDILQNDEKD
ncbi:MAG: MBL fold metallo-hydrolase [Acholeplasmatales bacterium]|jgi:glyoxylase-like metal-dependent hydrolase (beta-lactamase superfamily II)|nr:MBL fold metallo-hydrolase [Acholeplasmatales bacterium]